MEPTTMFHPFLWFAWFHLAIIQVQ
uniref:Uncharacterized protein n=1 Tax=Rhizophora mucronata TaxID=61149 RepID=A0A2P2P123_RHIMU